MSDNSIQPLQSWSEFHKAEAELSKARRKKQITREPFTAEEEITRIRVVEWIGRHRHSDYKKRK